MDPSQFQELIKILKSGNISVFINLVDKFTKNRPSSLTDSENYDKFRISLERSYYAALSYCLSTGQFDEFSKLFNYSDKLGIFFDVSNIDVLKIISKLHVAGINIGDTSRIIKLVSFFNKYNLFERKLTAEELKIIHEIKENDKLLVPNLKDLFGNVSDSLVSYVCKILPYDYVVWLSNMYKDYAVWLRDMYKSENYQGRRRLFDPLFLKNWTDYFSLYGLSIRNLGRVEDFIKRVETIQKSNNQNKNSIVLEFNPRYLYGINEDTIRVYYEKHLVYPENIIKIKEKILNKENYNFYSLSMIFFGGLGPEGYGFTYSTPKGEIIEICSDQKETEAIIIKFKQYLKRKFLDKLEKEMDSLNIDFDIRRKVIRYLSEVINPKDLISYKDKNSILRKIRKLLFQFNEFQKIENSEIEVILQQISSAISIIFKEVTLDDQFRTRMDLVASGKIKPEDIAKLTSLRGKSHYDVLRERFFLQNKPKWFFKDYPKEIKELEKEFRELDEKERNL